jgi:hypothetical protein
MSVLCFLLLIFLSWLTFGICNPSPFIQDPCPVYALKAVHMRAIFLHCTKISQLESFRWCANLAALFCTRSNVFICPSLWGSQHAAPYSRIGCSSDVYAKRLELLFPF